MTAAKVLALALAAGAVWSRAAAETPPDPAAFGRQPAVSEAAISADGTKIALIGENQGQRYVSIAPLDAGVSAVAPLGAFHGRGLQWIGDDYLTLKVSALLELHPNEGFFPGTREHADQDVVLNAQGKMVSTLLADDRPSAFYMYRPVIGRVLGPKPAAMIIGAHVDAVAVGGPGRLTDDGAYILPALWKVDVATGRGTISERGDKETATWWVDPDGEAHLRLDARIRPEREAFLYGRAKGAAGWKVILHTPETPQVLAFSAPEDAVYVRADTEAGRRIERIDIRTGASATAFDIAGSGEVGAVRNNLTGEVLGFSAQVAGDVRFLPLNPVFDAVIGKVSRALKGRTLRIHDMSKDGQKIILRAEAHDHPPVWYLFDVRRSELSPIGSAYPDLDGRRFGPTSYYTYKARDGLVIPAYLTLPAAPSGSTKLPLVVLPHGGPDARDYEGEAFDWWAQFLASSGYAVLQPQFRGSTGYGLAFETASRKEWGGKMQLDLIDGVEDLARKGVIDPARVCIVGASYGGYAALVGATLHPETFRCAVSVNGLSDLSLLAGEELRRHGRDKSLSDEMGETRADKAMIEATSPIRHVAALKGPVLVMVSSEDTTVLPEQSTNFVSAAAAAGKAVTLVKLEGDDHHLLLSDTRTKMLASLAAFLKVNLPTTQ
jgi:dipeptidyl aminopeptidase/acylaminoacyl peptidase